jgi:bifunctional UDP-N-acetylglucosamine pyrophosphorylase/glucosamine-1-phosphate N-acetyltransferase
MSSEAARPLTALVLAAGLGKRMRSRTIKLLHPVWGRPMLAWVLDALGSLRPGGIVVVLGHQAERIREALGGLDFQEVVQEEQRGTGHAVLTARPLLEGRDGDLLILNGDLPLLTGRTLAEFVAAHAASGAALSVLTTCPERPEGYGRIVREQEAVLRVVEEKDAGPAERAIREINCGVYLVAIATLLPLLDRLGTENAQGEYYLTDVIEMLVSSGREVRGVVHPDPREVLGVNDRRELAEAVGILGRRKREQLLLEGVTLIDPERTYIDPRARIGRDTTIYPGVWIEGSCVIGEDCIIRPNVHLNEVRIGNRVEIRNHCVIQDSRIEDGAQVGPFAHLRPGTYLSQRVRVGNFVETKKAVFGPGSKANHLSYLGDAELGANVNVGAGTITCNYDGVKKHLTIMEDGVFIGSDTQLVAPVKVGAGAYVGAGSTITEDVPPGALGLSRAKQRNIDGWAARKRKAREKSKAAAAQKDSASGTPAGAEAAAGPRPAAQAPGEAEE